MGSKKNMGHVGIIGGGVTGLAAALSLSKIGFQVTVFESDSTPMPASPEEAFNWNRRGAPRFDIRMLFWGDFITCLEIFILKFSKCSLTSAQLK